MLGHQVSSPIDQVGPNLITMLMGMGLKRDFDSFLDPLKIQLD